MADVTLTVREVGRNVTTIFTDDHTNAVSGSTYGFKNDGKTVLLAQLTAVAGTLTITTPNTVDGAAIADKALTLTQNKIVVIGPFPPNTYNDADGIVTVSVADATDLFAVRI